MSKELFRMKLRKTYIYLISFMSLTVMFTVCYYMSYRHALNQFNKNAIERNGQFAGVDITLAPTPLLTADDNKDNSISTDTNTSNTILPSTKYVLETYDMKTDTLTSEELNPPGYLVGLTREEVIAYLSDYMKDLPLPECNKGLFAYELLSFSPERVVIKKSYNADMVPFRFYVVVRNGYVVVYNSDLKSVYSYTHIEAKSLPEDDRIKLIQGIYINTLDELYSLLESYSS